ncbi:Mis12 protein-domain-containing protein [Dichomitus squalens]|uniref:Mis12 protein-domain-containing protein n=1 Tax=Dichomitus squalens TaxID=114155 RepID=A0A4Q9MQ97_9APHY|nr:Mis12 protein-domain-containing protein [Dichomitus squalens]TBU57163.1 Mis12 protein-domain-containing protein [Dichomitus squalens]
MSAPAGPPPTVPSVLLPELLGFIPQFLLDDIINIANDEARHSVDAMEQFLQRWADARVSNPDPKSNNPDWDPTQEIEQGLVAFQTLLESHVDVAFDFFEAWSMRNIFAVDADLPVVAPHQAGLDLQRASDEPEREGELLAEIDELRRKVHAQRKLKRLFTRAVRKSSKDLEHARARLDRLAFLRAPQMHSLLSLPAELQTMYAAVSSLPPVDASAPTPVPDQPGKRPWETSKTGYLNWAVAQLMERAKERAKGEQADEGDASFGEGSAEVGAAAAAAYSVGRAEDMKAILEAVGGDPGAESTKGRNLETMDTRPG